MVKLEKAEAEVALEDAPVSGMFSQSRKSLYVNSCCVGGKRPTTPIEAAESKRPRLDEEKDQVSESVVLV